MISQIDYLIAELLNGYIAKLLLVHKSTQRLNVLKIKRILTM
jgi:hypothetical protein